MHKQVSRGTLIFAALTMILFAALCATPSFSQESPASPPSGRVEDLQHRPPSVSPTSSSIALTVPPGTPLEVALDKELRVRAVGQPVQGRLIEPVYAFDQLVMPAGSIVTGKVTKIESVSAGHRTEAALNADFTPARKIEIEFDEAALPGGKHIPLQTTVAPGSGQVLDFVAPAQKQTGVVAAKVHQAREQARSEWNAALNQLHSPGKLHRVERYALAQSPARPQYIEAGSVYFAELQAPLDFGNEPLTPRMAEAIGNLPADGGVVHARLATPLTSAANHKGDIVDAVITRPLFDGDRLIVPQGSELSGTVVQVQPARRLSRNGELRIVFHELRLPDGLQQKIDANLESVQAGKSANLKLDSEGGAQATTPKTRYLSTAVSLGLAALSARGDEDAAPTDTAGTTGGRIAGGAGGYKLIGVALGVAVHSRAFGYSMGAYGAGMSVYKHFLARGRDVVFPKDTAMQIGLGTHQETPAAPPSPAGS